MRRSSVGVLSAKVDLLNSRIERVLKSATELKAEVRKKRTVNVRRLLIARRLRKSNVGRK
jgi:hypothetical protein